MVGTGSRAADSVDINCMIFIFLVPMVAFKFASFQKGKKGLYLCLVYHSHFLKGFGAMVSVSVLSYYK